MLEQLGACQIRLVKINKVFIPKQSVLTCSKWWYLLENTFCEEKNDRIDACESTVENTSGTAEHAPMSK